MEDGYGLKDNNFISLLSHFPNTPPPPQDFTFEFSLGMVLDPLSLLR
jgi:hypothetical protein